MGSKTISLPVLARWLIVFLTIALVLGAPLLFITYGMDFTDTPCLIRSFRYPDVISQQTWLTRQIALGWESFFGDTFISMKVLGYLVLEAEILVVFIFFYRQKDALLLCGSIIASCILTFSLSSFIFNHYQVTCALFTLIFLLLVKISRKINYWLLWICGVFSVLAILARFPNIILIPCMLLILGLLSFSQDDVRHSSTIDKLFQMLRYWLTFISGAVFATIVFFVFFETPTVYLPDLFSAVSGAESSDHSIGLLIDHSIQNGISVTKYFALILFLFLGYVVAIEKLNWNKYLAGILLFLIYLMYLYSVAHVNTYNEAFSLNITAFLSGLIIFLCIQLLKEKKYPDLLLLSSAFLFMFVSVAGTNTGLLKCSRFLIFFIPLFFIWLYKEKVPETQKMFFTIMLCSLVAFGCYNRMSWFYGDSHNMAELKFSSSNPKLLQIKTTAPRIELIDKVMGTIKEHKEASEEVVFFGPAGEMFYYLLDKKPLLEQTFLFKPDDPAILGQLSDLIIRQKKHPLVVILNGNPDNKEWPQYLLSTNAFTDEHSKNITDNSAPLKSLLFSEHYRQIESNAIFSVFQFGS